MQMKKSKRALTEFEGALLTEVHRRAPCTAYQVRRAFETSRSFEWSGSAGAVYPAIRRLTRRGMLVAEAAGDDGRGTRKLTLSEDGVAAVRAWVCDVERAVGPGFDPFRTRSSEWETLPPAKRRAHIQELMRALDLRIAELEEAISLGDEECTTRIELDLALQRSRVEWLEAQRGNQGPGR
jgi:DNA-binding PadR family transcriptional regulator